MARLVRCPSKSPENHAARELGPATVAYDGTFSKCASYGYTEPGAEVCTFLAFLLTPDDCQPRFVLTDDRARAACYEGNGFAWRPDLDRRQAHLLPGWGMREVQVWERAGGESPDLRACAPR